VQTTYLAGNFRRFAHVLEVEDFAARTSDQNEE
jgi:hypothetical protein